MWPWIWDGAELEEFAEFEPLEISGVPVEEAIV